MNHDQLVIHVIYIIQYCLHPSGPLTAPSADHYGRAEEQGSR